MDNNVCFLYGTLYENNFLFGRFSVYQFTIQNHDTKNGKVRESMLLLQCNKNAYAEMTRLLY